MADEDSLRHKYTPLPEDGPRHRKKSKKRHVRSDHRHEYEEVCIDMHLDVYTHGKKIPYLYVGKRCRICGRMADWRSRADLQEPPEGMPFYAVPDWTYLFDNKVLPEEMRVR